MRVILFSMILVWPLFLHAQSVQITVVRDTSIQRVMKLYQSFATEKRVVSGFRVQLASNSSRSIIMDLKSRFMQQYPEVNAYVVYQQPQLKLRVGDFTSRAEVTQFMNEIKGSFPTAFVVPDKVIVKGIPW